MKLGKISTNSQMEMRKQSVVIEIEGNMIMLYKFNVYNKQLTHLQN